MSEKVATEAKRARANTDGKIYEEKQKELIQKIYELKKVIKILADTQLQYIKYFESADEKLNKIYEKNVIYLFIYLFLITRLESLDYDEAILNTYE